MNTLFENPSALAKAADGGAFYLVPIQARAVADGIRDFFEEHFNASVKIDCSVDDPYFISISEEGLALLFKTLISSVFGKSVIYSDIRTVGREFRITCSWKADKFDDELSEELMHYARLSGFSSFEKYEDGRQRIILTANLSSTKFTPIYAKHTNPMYAALHRAIIIRKTQ